ncbi:MAG: YHS domain-containing (seleno)protein [Bacteroidota bacterium]
MANLHAQDKTKQAFFQVEGVAIDGYDVVAYFTEDQAQKGIDQYQVSYGGVRWLFNSQAHVDSFAANPQAYLPAYGGYCAYGMAFHGRYEVSGEVWEIVEGKLYLFHPAEYVFRKWTKNRANLQARADKFWQKKSNP